jgi:thiamine biosynthesis protein ThiI
MAVFRPCIGLDKEEIIHFSKRIKAFETSIQPFDDCCTLFSPEHPLTRPKKTEMVTQYNQLELLPDMLEKAVNEAMSFIL